MKTESIYIEESDKIYTVLIGQNAAENEQIIKASNPNDLWFHFENCSGPHVVLQNDGNDIGKRYLFQVAIKLFENKPKVPKNQKVIYTEIKNVKLTKTLGTVIPKNIRILKIN
jgi:predicted ribosome quality control (RQC) complex YloA/Tae2 family protein